MTDHPRGLSGLVAELKRRHVFRTLLAYGAAAFVVLQAAEIVLPAFGVSDQVLQLVVGISVLGLPVVLALAWVYEITPRGIRTTKQVDLEAGRRLEEEGSLLPRLGLLAVTILAAVSAGTYWFSAAAPRSDAGPGGPLPESASPAFRAADDASADVPVRSLAVLPLESFAPPSDDEAGAARGDYFAAGMHEALVSRLSRAGSFRVISRTTVQQYDPSGKSMAQIGAELGVEGIVEGSVTTDGDRVRITVQLIHAPSDTHLWSADYERQLEDVIALQGEVAGAIAGAITGELGERSADGVRMAGPDAPAVDPDAAVAEMKGRLALSTATDGRDADVEAAEHHFRDALAEDSAYVPALVGLAGSTLMREIAAGDPSAATLREVGRQIERALRLDPESPEARDLQVVVREIGETGAGAADVPEAPAAPGVVTTDLGARLRALRFEGIHGAGSSSAGARGRAARVEGARTLLAVGRHQEAEDLLRDVLEEALDYEPAWTTLERLLLTTGHVDGIVPLRTKRRDAVGAAASVEGAPSLESLAAGVADDGVRGYWRWRLREIEALRAAGREVSAVDEASAYAALGRSEQAFAVLDRAVAQGDRGLLMLRSDPTWDPYRRDPRFQAAIAHASGRRAPGPA